MKNLSIWLNKGVVAMLFLALAATAIATTNPSLKRLEPPFWWTGFKNPALQLMVYGEKISSTKPEINYKGVQIESYTGVENPNYMFINLKIDANTLPGTFQIAFKLNGKVVITAPYELKNRETGSANRVGFNSSDVMYLIMPDRFANGDPTNDSKPDQLEKPNRANPDGRHGGDIKGIQDHLDYIADNGYTTVWVNPVLENNMPDVSYHGYSTTDFYKVDPRFGSNEDYRQLSQVARKKGIKMVMDMIFNHCGSYHWWMKDMPMKDWINNYPDYKITNHRKSLAQDPYASNVDKQEFSDGWFVPSMPDLNQRNPYMERYLIQNSIWWIEYVGLNGIRMDTYSYPDKEMMARWTCEVLNEYPNFGIVGEEWTINPAQVSFWQKDKVNPNGYTSCLPNLMDFPNQDALVRSSVSNDGFNQVYETIALDYLYPHPNNLVIFAENHDTQRFYSTVNENINTFKTAMVFLMTTRGIPQTYYGSEVLMTGLKKDGDGFLRKDFPGGWTGDKVNAFTGEGLTPEQSDFQQFMKKLINWRKGKDVIHNGSLKHYYPKDNFYVYFRTNDHASVMVVINSNHDAKTLDTSRFAESLKGFSTGKEVLTGKAISDLKSLQIPANTSMIIELQ